VSQTEARRRTGLWVWCGLAVALAVVLCFVPLFDLLGYELALAVTPLCAAAALQLGLREVAHHRARLPFSAREAADLRPFRAMFGLVIAALIRAAPVLLLPLVISIANMLRVRNCNPAIGLVWYGVLPVASAVFAASLGVALGVVLPALTRPLASVGAALALLLAALGWCLWRLWAAPPIFVFDPLFGYFAGSIYDEHVAVPTALWWARGYHAALVAAALTGGALFLDGHALRTRVRAARRRHGLMLLALASFAAALAGYRCGPALGYRHDAATIAAALGGERRTEHFVLHYRPDGPYAAEIADVGTELELDHARLRAQLGIEPLTPVHAYLFGSALEKQALMGAGHTYIAKPWRGEIYVNHEPFPQLVLAHELAHVFGARAGDPILGVARHGLRLDVGLIEGLAEATSWRSGSLTADEVVRVLELLGRAPSLDAVMSPRFWSLPAQQAYAIAGSFCRFLLDERGAGPLLSLYRAGGDRAAYPHLYGADFATLEGRWRARIATVAIEPATLERERDRILRPSIFRRPCAHELARLLELARARAGLGDHEGARALYARVCADEPDDPGHLDEELIEASRADARAEARAVAARLLAHPKASAKQRAAAHAVLGDLFARQGAHAEAARQYALAEREPTDEGTARLYTVERTLAERIAQGEPGPLLAARVQALAALAHAGTNPAEDYLRLTRAASDAPADALLAYLAARQLSGRALWSESEALLARALAGALPDDRFVHEAERLRAEIAFRRRDFAGAAARFEALAGRGTPAFRADAQAWAERARFFAAHAPAEKP
jgi:hypothetical protein